METKIVNLLSDICGAEPEEITPDLQLFEEGLLDSFAVIQLVMSLEETFGISLKIEKIPRERLATPKAIESFIQEALQ